MKIYIALFSLVMMVTSSFSQNYTLKIDSLNSKQTTNFNQFKVKEVSQILPSYLTMKSLTDIEFFFANDSR